MERLGQTLFHPAACAVARNRTLCRTTSHSRSTLSFPSLFGEWGPLYDHRLGSRVSGPFEDRDDFHHFLRKGLDFDHLDEGRFSEVVVSHQE